MRLKKELTPTASTIPNARATIELT